MTTGYLDVTLHVVLEFSILAALVEQGAKPRYPSTPPSHASPLFGVRNLATIPVIRSHS
jgi:hypothetical protein